MSAERRIYWSVGLFSLALLLGAFFIPDDPVRQEDLPWHIEQPTPDSLRIFGLTLGQSTAADVERRFEEGGELTLFKSPDGRLTAEMYFDQLDLAGLRSKMVVTIAVPETELKEIYERGLRIASTGNGRKVTLAPEDAERIRKMPIDSLTYMPAVRVDEAMFLKRFGKPEQRIREAKSGIIHWLYPSKGVDIVFGEGSRPLMQYVAPRNFHRLLKPLQAGGEILP